MDEQPTNPAGGGMPQPADPTQVPPAGDPMQTPPASVPPTPTGVPGTSTTDVPPATDTPATDVPTTTEVPGTDTTPSTT
jgi:hypothetical protein